MVTPTADTQLMQLFIDGLSGHVKAGEQAVKLAIALDRAVSLKDLLRTPVLADLATLLDERSVPSPVPSPRVPEGSTP